MIKFELKCQASHVFEGWFRDGATFDVQSSAGEITCPICGSTSVEKALMAPRIGKSRSSEVQQDSERKQAAMLKHLRELRTQVEQNARYVGVAFAEEARRIHYGELAAEAIYGEATDNEAKALEEEGVAFARIPWVPSAN